MAAEGKVRAVIGHSLPLAEARRSHELLAGPHLGKIVLVP
jgi:NADPH:quinone reductase-like Zn-dependent oxidoreductase